MARHSRCSSASLSCRTTPCEARAPGPTPSWAATTTATPPREGAAGRRVPAGGAEAEVAAAYVAWLARRQIEGGAAYLDLNVDEIDPAVDGRLEAMTWLV